jgi:hypothetical protein
MVCSAALEMVVSLGRRLDGGMYGTLKDIMLR